MSQRLMNMPLVFPLRSQSRCAPPSGCLPPNTQGTITIEGEKEGCEDGLDRQQSSAQFNGPVAKIGYGYWNIYVCKPTTHPVLLGIDKYS